MGEFMSGTLLQLDTDGESWFAMSVESWNDGASNHLSFTDSRRHSKHIKVSESFYNDHQNECTHTHTHAYSSIYVFRTCTIESIETLKEWRGK